MEKEKSKRNRFKRSCAYSSRGKYVKKSHEAYLKECHEEFIKVSVQIDIPKEYITKVFGKIIRLTEAQTK